MKSKLDDKLLYLVTARTWLEGEPLESAVKSAIEGGVNVVQIREKGIDQDEFVLRARALKCITDRYSVPLIINDNVQVAAIVGASGVHLGGGDMAVAQARQALGNDSIIGASARTVDAAKRAEQDGADYLGVGAVFGTSTKADAKTIDIETFRTIAAAVEIPCIAIGGVSLDNIKSLKNSGACGVAVVSAILAAKNIKSAAREFTKRLAQL